MNKEREKGPQHIGKAPGGPDKVLVTHDSQRQKRIEAAARPGESWDQAAARLREEEAKAERERSSLKWWRFSREDESEQRVSRKIMSDTKYAEVQADLVRLGVIA